MGDTESAENKIDEDIKDLFFKEFPELEANQDDLKEVVLELRTITDEVEQRWGNRLTESTEDKIEILENRIYRTLSRSEVITVTVDNPPACTRLAEALLNMLIERSGATETGRGAQITDGLSTQRRVVENLNTFHKEVLDLFSWYDEGHQKSYRHYVAPYFALIQSSGMGKTKLCYDLRTEINEHQNSSTVCKMFLCSSAEIQNDKLEKYYDGRFSKEEVKMQLNSELAKIVNESDKSVDKVVFIFDEAQGLMDPKDKPEESNLPFRRIRWWLREKRDIKVVAVFTGTLAKLSNFFPPDPPENHFSRDAKPSYLNYNPESPDSDSNERNLQLFSPFFELLTIGCLHEMRTAVSNPSELMVAIMYGRPLFSFYLTGGDPEDAERGEGRLDRAKLVNFLKRLVLSKGNKYQHDDLACFSVLGSRVQMGTLNSFEDISAVVSGGYACLTQFTPPSSSQSRPPIARTVFMPDPLVAFIAMKLMSGTNEIGVGIHGKDAKFWVEKAKKAFSTSLCQPEKGDPGEIFCALYLLLCADRIRKTPGLMENKLLETTLSVSFAGWWSQLKNGGHDTSNKKTELPTKKPRIERGNPPTLEVCFIQVWRDYLRDSSAYFDSGYLKYLYKSATAVYAYPGCKAFDILVTIRRKNISNDVEDGYFYHPMLVSVKNWSGCTLSDLRDWMKKLSEFIKSHRHDAGTIKAFCLVVLVGCDLPSHSEKADSAISKADYNEYCNASMDAFPDNDVFRILAIPEKDAFGIRAAINEVAMSVEGSEVYASHAPIPFRKAYSDKVLRSKSNIKGKTKKLFEDLQDNKTRSKAKTNQGVV
eukprot:scaffold4428_cov228-Amphora_coffeaeformis.AAC.6